MWMTAYHKEGHHFLEFFNLALDLVAVGGVGLQATLSKGLASLVHGAHAGSHLLLYSLPIKLVHWVMQPSPVTLLRSSVI